MIEETYLVVGWGNKWSLNLSGRDAIHFPRSSGFSLHLSLSILSLQMMCWWAENPDGNEFKRHLARVPDYLWLAEDGMKMQTFGSQLWDCAFATQAIIASDMVEEYGDSLQKAHFYLKETQIKKNPPGDYQNVHRQITNGSWAFSDQDMGWAVSDCTSEALKGNFRMVNHCIKNSRPCS